eukprot:3071472-Prorocentrum_lima.AAC.1
MRHEIIALRPWAHGFLELAILKQGKPPKVTRVPAGAEDALRGILQGHVAIPWSIIDERIQAARKRCSPPNAFE